MVLEMTNLGSRIPNIARILRIYRNLNIPRRYVGNDLRPQWPVSMGYLQLSDGLLWGVVASCFELLGSPGAPAFLEAPFRM